MRGFHFLSTDTEDELRHLQHPSWKRFDLYMEFVLIVIGSFVAWGLCAWLLH